MNLLEQLIRDENCILHPYKDSKRIWTIAIGRNLEAEGFSEAEKALMLNVPLPPYHLPHECSVHPCPLLIAREDAIMLCNNDINKHSSALRSALPWTDDLDVVRRCSLINMTFNMGIGVVGGTHGLLSFKDTLALIKGGHYAEAGNHILQSKFHADTGIRAVRIAKQLETGEWQ
jgi:lysozyme